MSSRRKCVMCCCRVRGRGREWVKYVVRTHQSVMCWWVMFCKIIGTIVGAAAPVYGELALAYAVFDPIKTHVHRLGASLFDCVIQNSGRARIVGLYWSGALRMAQVIQDIAKDNAVLSIVKGSSCFCFCGRGKNNGHDGAVCMDGAIWRWWDGIGCWCCVGWL